MSETPPITSRPITPLDLDAIFAQLYALKRRREADEPDDGKIYIHRSGRVDPVLLTKHGIPFHYEREDVIIMSPADIKRAKEVGAIS